VAQLTEVSTEAPARSNSLKDKALKTLGDLPPFSPILNRLLATLAAGDVNFSKLGALIEKDTVVTGNLLHLVNSALYARRGTVNSVGHALSLLGLDKVRNAVLGMSITTMWKKIKMPASWSMARFNMHSAASGVLSDLLAQKLPVVYPEGAFVAGLLHDVGQLVIALGLPQQHDQIMQLRKMGRTRLEAEQEILGFTHPELSADALKFWNLPEPIQEAVLLHHDMKAAGLGRVVNASNQYVNSIGFAILPEGDLEWVDATMVESLGLDAERLAVVLADFNTEYKTLVQYFR
jgi:HD-like signal output (HDOD) protein